MNDKTKYQMLKQREAMKGYTAADATAEPTDQQQGMPCPPPLKEGKAAPIPLPMDFSGIGAGKSLPELLRHRESHRKYLDEGLSLGELSFLLWATQGVRHYAGKEGQVTFRNVPSAGSRHPLETYLFLRDVDTFRPGVYHYLPGSHSLEPWDSPADYGQALTEALCGQAFAASAPVTFVWSALPYRTEWRYGVKAHKYILLDAGHVCENLYLACGAIGCGACAVGAYDQDLLDELLGFMPGPSGDEDCEFALYVAAVGKVGN